MLNKPRVTVGLIGDPAALGDKAPMVAEAFRQINAMLNDHELIARVTKQYRESGPIRVEDGFLWALPPVFDK